MEEVAVFFPSCSDEDLDVSGMREDREAVLGDVGAAARMRATMAPLPCCGRIA